MIVLLEGRKQLQLIGDKGYVSEDLEDRLWEEGEYSQRDKSRIHDLADQLRYGHGL